MKRPVFTLLILAIALTTLAQATQPCIVKQYNQKQQKTPLAGVQVEVRGAQTATSAANGAVTLQFATLKPGDRVPFRAATKAGFELMNKTAVEQWNISRDGKTEGTGILRQTQRTRRPLRQPVEEPRRIRRPICPHRPERTLRTGTAVHRTRPCRPSRRGRRGIQLPQCRGEVHHRRGERP